jgi:hypothetical protein
MKTIRFTIAFITIISFSCKQQLVKKTDVNNAGKEIRLSITNASSLLVPATLTAKQNNTIADRPACCKKVPSRFKLNASD